VFVRQIHLLDVNNVRLDSLRILPPKPAENVPLTVWSVRLSSHLGVASARLDFTRKLLLEFAKHVRLTVAPAPDQTAASPASPTSGWIIINAKTSHVPLTAPLVLPLNSLGVLNVKLPSSLDLQRVKLASNTASAAPELALRTAKHVRRDTLKMWFRLRVKHVSKTAEYVVAILLICV